MKKSIIGLASLLLSFSLVGCGEGDTSTLGSTKQDDTGTSVSQNDDTSSAEMETFEIQTSDNGLSVANDSYTFSTVQEGDDFPPEASIRMVTDSSWTHCSGLNERYTRIVAEDSNVLPEGSVSLDLVKNSDIVGSSGSNEIDAIDIEFDRTLINPGETKLKIEVRPNNGSSTINKLTTICINVEVKEFGTIEVETYNVNINVDLNGLQDLITELDIVPTEMTLNVTDQADEKDVYGYSADYHLDESIDIENIPSTVEISNLKYAVGHTYQAWIFIECNDYKDRVWIGLEATSNDSSYTLEQQEAGSSTLVVKEDNVTVNAKLGDYHKNS